MGLNVNFAVVTGALSGTAFIHLAPGDRLAQMNGHKAFIQGKGTT